MSELEETGFELLLDAFIDGDLEPVQRQALLATAAEDPTLGAELAVAVELQQALAGLPEHQVPASLNRKLQKIAQPESHWAGHWLLRPRWAFAAMLVFSLIGGREIYQQHQQVTQQAELAQARQDLALVLAYLDKVNRSVNAQIQMTVNEATAKPVVRVTTKTLQSQLQPRKDFEL
ncbi:MAG: hypothetical protein V7754_02600 [Halioglobus sp.]